MCNWYRWSLAAVNHWWLSTYNITYFIVYDGLDTSRAYDITTLAPFRNRPNRLCESRVVFFSRHTTVDGFECTLLFSIRRRYQFTTIRRYVYIVTCSEDFFEPRRLQSVCKRMRISWRYKMRMRSNDATVTCTLALGNLYIAKNTQFVQFIISPAGGRDDRR